MSNKNIGAALIEGTTYFTVARILTFGFAALNSVFLARFLGVEGYGLWKFAYSVFGIFVLFSGLPGTAPAIVRYVSKYMAENESGKVRTLVLTSLKLQFIFVGVCCGMVFLLAAYVAGNVFSYSELAILLPVLALGHFFTSLNLMSIFNAFKKFHYTAFLTVLGSALSFFLTILFLSLGWGVVGAAVGQALYMIITSILAFFWAFRLLPRSTSIGEAESEGFVSTSKMIFSYGVPLSVVGLLSSFSIYFRDFLLGLSLEGLEVLGYFSVAWGITNILRMSTSLVTEPLFPVISELESKKNWATIEKVLSTLFKYMILIAGTVMIFVQVFAREIINSLYSESFEPAAVLLRMIIIIVLPTVFIHLSDTLFKGTGHSGIILKINLINSLFWIPATVFLVLNFGVVGAVARTIAGFFGFGCILRVYFLKKSYSIFPFQLKPLIGIVPVFGILFSLLLFTKSLMASTVFHLFFVVILALSMTLLLACILGIVKKEEIKVLRISLPVFLSQKCNSIFSFLERIARE